jgi:hypothetical protein
MKLLDKISEKIEGINPKNINDPLIIALSPYMKDIMYHITPVIEAIQSSLIYDEFVERFIPEDSKFDPFQLFHKERALFTGVLYSEFYKDQRGVYDLNVVYLPHLNAKNECPHSFLKLIHFQAEMRGFNLKSFLVNINIGKSKETDIQPFLEVPII